MLMFKLRTNTCRRFCGVPTSNTSKTCMLRIALKYVIAKSETCLRQRGSSWHVVMWNATNVTLMCQDVRRPWRRWSSRNHIFLIPCILEVGFVLPQSSVPRVKTALPRSVLRSASRLLHSSNSSSCLSFEYIAADLPTSLKGTHDVYELPKSNALPLPRPYTTSEAEAVWGPLPCQKCLDYITGHYSYVVCFQTFHLPTILFGWRPAVHCPLT